MKVATSLVVLAAALALAACGRKDTEQKATSSGVAPAATTPGTQTPGTPPGGTPQPTSADPKAGAPAPASSITPRNVTFGTAVADKKVSVITDTLAAKETAYLSLDLYGSGDAKVRVNWIGPGPDGKPQTLQSDSETLKVTQPTSLAFPLRRAEGFPVGAYEVQVFVNEVPAGTKKFTVK